MLGYEMEILDITRFLNSAGVKLTKEAMKICEKRLKRLDSLPKWNVTIEPAFW